MEVAQSNCSTPSMIVPSPTSYRDIADFLAKHTVQKNENMPNNKNFTNTRIGDKTSNIYGGTYYIPDAEYSTFLKLYYRDIIVPQKKEYLTEKQRDADGPILVDLDFRHKYETDERQYTKEHIEDLVDAYLDELKNIYQLDDSSVIPVYVFEKPTVNRVQEKNLTKDGIHMIIGIQADHITQQILRNRMIMKAAQMWKDFPIINTWEDVFDEGISTGKVNWQLYGSRKPNFDRYRLTHVYNAKFDVADEMFQTPELPLSKFDLEKNFEKLSVRYKGHLSLFMKNDFVTAYNDYKRVHRLDGAGSIAPASASVARQQKLEFMMDDNSTISKITNVEELDLVLNHLLDNAVETTADYELKSTYDYLMILPVSYYGEGSYSKWIRVGWALRNINNKLLVVWVKFSSQSSSFSYSEIPKMCELWRGFDMRKHGGLTKNSLMYWAKNDANEAYDRVRMNTLDYYIEKTINTHLTAKSNDRKGYGDFDLATVNYINSKHVYVCTSVKSNIWYRYKNNRWQEDDSGTSLRKSISTVLRNLYNKKSLGSIGSLCGDVNQLESSSSASAAASASASSVTLATAQNESDISQREIIERNRSIRILNICERLSSTNDKKNIMTESKELFYDGTFYEKLDTNPYLICFNNGIIDFKTREFRKGQPEDNISMCTNIDYIKLNPTIHKPIMDEIHDFMNKLFPDKSLCAYMWDHLASTLIGITPNQTFNMYIGIGSNGKSVLVTLMKLILGDYFGEVPPTLITEKRGKIGGCSPELALLKGKRYAVMQEPEKDEVINEGIMKQLTSGKDPVQARALYSGPISFIPQFKMVLTCNKLVGVKANDHGTWRRIRAVPFKSLFTSNPIEGDKDKPYQFKMDPTLDEKVDAWKEVFASMLVERVFTTNGMVDDCDIVMAKSNEYRKSQDYLAEFVNDRLNRDANSRVKKLDLNNEFSVWYMANYGGRGPSPKELHEYMDKEFGRQRNSVWHGVQIRYDKEEDNDQDNANNDEEDAFVDNINPNDLR